MAESGGEAFNPLLSAALFVIGLVLFSYGHGDGLR
jgi:hypothetical protein